MATIEVTDEPGAPGQAGTVALVARERSGRVVAAGRLSTDPSGWALEADTATDTPDAATGTADAATGTADAATGTADAAAGTADADTALAVAELLTTAAATVAGRGGGNLTWWVPRPGPRHERAARAAGLAPGRVLYQMRRSLPVDPEHRRGAEPLATRAFRPGADEESWLEVNNRAFAWHPEQGGWTLGTIREQEAEPWFDPAGFLLHETGGSVDGFCWTKVHSDEDPVLGEIYVIAADPAAAGGGFGRRLVLAGLDHLAARGIEVGMLYTDATNERAVKLYVDLGFTVHELLRAFTVTLPAAPGAS